MNKQNFETLKEKVKNKKLIVWGYKNEYTCLRELPIYFIVDKNDELCEKKGMNGTLVYMPEILYSEDPDDVVVFVATPEKYYSDITVFLNNLSISNIFYMNAFENDFLNDISTELYDSMDETIKVCNLLNDSLSMKIYKEVINRRISGCVTGYSDLKVSDEIQYIFPPALFSKTEGAIIDCGGYIGDSIERFVNALGFNNIDKIYTFEALPENLCAINELKQNYKTDGEKIWIVPAAVSDKAGTAVFMETEKRGASHISGKKTSDKYAENKPISQMEVKCVSIDETIQENEPVRYIKMDIEGGEYDALMGAKRTIIREKPGLAISIYHSAEDYYRLALLIKEFVPEYKMAIRHHKDKYFDTVLYAWK